MELNQIDLNLLVVFQQLMIERRVSRAAENLGLSQPAVSHSPAKMRRIFGDELRGTDLVATVPERLAQHLAEPFELTYLPHPLRLLLPRASPDRRLGAPIQYCCEIGG